MSLGIYFQGEANRVCLWFTYNAWKREIKLDSTVCFLSNVDNSNAIYLEGEEWIRIENLEFSVDMLSLRYIKRLQFYMNPEFRRKMGFIYKI